jgi:hypothetical protein
MNQSKTLKRCGFQMAKKLHATFMLCMVVHSLCFQEAIRSLMEECALPILTIVIVSQILIFESILTLWLTSIIFQCILRFSTPNAGELRNECKKKIKNIERKRLE